GWKDGGIGNERLAGAACNWRHQALRAQRSGERPQRSKYYDRQACCPRERSTRVRDWIARDRYRGCDVLLQPPGWRLRLREQISAHRCLEERLELQRIRAVGLGSGAQCGKSFFGGHGSGAARLDFLWR